MLDSDGVVALPSTSYSAPFGATVASQVLAQ